MIYFRRTILTIYLQNSPDRPFIDSSYYKLHAFGLHEAFDKIVFLDADTMVLKNIDELFSRDISTGYPFAASPEIMPPDHFNTGVMVIRPSARVHRELLQAAPHTESLDGTEASFLNAFFRNWFKQSSQHRLPFEYNVLQVS